MIQEVLERDLLVGQRHPGNRAGGGHPLDDQALLRLCELHRIVQRLDASGRRRQNAEHRLRPTEHLEQQRPGAVGDDRRDQQIEVSLESLRLRGPYGPQGFARIEARRQRGIARNTEERLGLVQPPGVGDPGDPGAQQPPLARARCGRHAVPGAAVVRVLGSVAWVHERPDVVARSGDDHDVGLQVAVAECPTGEELSAGRRVQPAVDDLHRQPAGAQQLLQLRRPRLGGILEEESVCG